MGLAAPGMWDPPRRGMEPMAPAHWPGGFLTTEPPGKSPAFLGVGYFCHLYCLAQVAINGKQSNHEASE